LRVIEPEAYPQEVLADEEPKYLRRQKPLEIRRRKFGKKTWKTWLRVALWTGAGIAGAGCAYFCGQFLLASPEMLLSHPDQVQVKNYRYVDPAAIIEVFAADRGHSVLRIPLDERRHQLEAIPWIEQATVRRALPNRLQIEVTERTPIAFLREGSSLSLIDIHGVILERPLHENFHFPVITGIRADMPIDDREARTHLFAGFMQGVESARKGSADQVGEVDVSDDHDVRATLIGLQSGIVDSESGTTSAAPVTVHFGDGDFQAKYQTLLEKIGEVRAKTGPLESIDMRFDGEIVADPDTAASTAIHVASKPSATKPPASKPAARAARHSH
jgi:cell division protein FtsQ